MYGSWEFVEQVAAPLGGILVNRLAQSNYAEPPQWTIVDMAGSVRGGGCSDRQRHLSSLSGSTMGSEGRRAGALRVRLAGL